MIEKYVPKHEEKNSKSYSECLAAEYEVTKILGEIEKVFTMTQHKEEAEKIILEKWAHKMEEALAKSRKAFDMWLKELEGAKY